MLSKARDKVRTYFAKLGRRIRAPNSIVDIVRIIAAIFLVLGAFATAAFVVQQFGFALWPVVAAAGVFVLICWIGAHAIVAELADAKAAISIGHILVGIAGAV